MSLIPQTSVVIDQCQGKKVLRTKICQEEPIRVIQEEDFNDNVVNIYQEQTNVPASTLTTIFSYTVPLTKELDLRYIEGSGDNIAEYYVLVDSTVIAKKRSYFTEYNVELPFYGITIGSGSTIEIKVLHTRASTGDFESRIVGDLEDE